MNKIYSFFDIDVLEGDWLHGCSHSLKGFDPNHRCTPVGATIEMKEPNGKSAREKGSQKKLENSICKGYEWHSFPLQLPVTSDALWVFL